MPHFGFSANVINAVQERKHDGRDFLVAPAIILKEGVLKGELNLANEFGKYPATWNGIPITLGHPTRRGTHVSANDLDITNLGRVHNVDIVDGRLRAELWLDKSKLGAAGDDGAALVARLSTGEQTDVSSAFYRDVQLESGRQGGKPYDGIARNYRPDHVAILLEGEGECSVHDGCGVPRTNAAETDDAEMCDCIPDKLAANVLSRARRPAFKGTAAGSWSAPSLTDYLRAYTRTTGRSIEGGGSVANLPQAAKNWIASRTLLGDPNAETRRDLIFFPVVGTDGRLYRNALTSVLGGRGSQAQIGDTARSSAQSMSRSLLRSQFGVQPRTQAADDKDDDNSLVKELFAFLSHKLGVGPTEEENPMDKLIDIILAHESFENKSREDLEALPESALKVLAAGLVEDEDEDEDGTGDNEPGEGEGDNEPGEGDNESGEGGDKMPAWARTWTAQVDAKVDALVSNQADGEKQRKQEIIAAMSRDDDFPWSEKDLLAMDVGQLEKVAKLAQPAGLANYSGRGGSGVPAGGNDLIVELPAIMSFEEVATNGS